MGSARWRSGWPPDDWNRPQRSGKMPATVTRPQLCCMPVPESHLLHDIKPPTFHLFIFLGLDWWSVWISKFSECYWRTGVWDSDQCCILAVKRLHTFQKMVLWTSTPLTKKRLPLSLDSGLNWMKILFPRSMCFKVLRHSFRITTTKQKRTQNFEKRFPSSTLPLLIFSVKQFILCRIASNGTWRKPYWHHYFEGLPPTRSRQDTCRRAKVKNILNQASRGVSLISAWTMCFTLFSFQWRKLKWRREF